MCVGQRRWYVRVASWCCLFSTTLGGPQINDATRAALQRSLGPSLTSAIVACTNEVVSCNVAAVAVQLAEVADLLTSQFQDCPSGCSFQQPYCDEFFSAVQNMFRRRDHCLADNDFGAQCLQMVSDLNTTVQSNNFELGVMCSIISPGANQERLPQCRTVARSIVATTPTLSNCPSLSRSDCINHFCSVLTKFFWRVRPRNLQDPSVATNLFPSSFVLPGCESVSFQSFDNFTCPSRLDVHAFCDCLCPIIPTVEGPPLAECPMDADEYFLFGKFGVQDSLVSGFCVDGLCKTLETSRTLPGCDALELPADSDCQAMQLPFAINGNACPWLQHSGGENILQCVDGHRCSVLVDGWDCCQTHLGRAKCPSNSPLMCSVLCGTEGEYCCRPLGSDCTPRSCSVIFAREPGFLVTTTTITSSLPPPGTAIEEPWGLNIRLPQGWWVWPVTMVPILFGIIIGWLVYRRALRLSMQVDELLTDADVKHDTDALGGFTVVKSLSKKKPKKRTPTVFVEVQDVPEKLDFPACLGLEFVDTRVVRVEYRGRRNGFKVGDVVVDVAGSAVSTLEEIAKQVDVERARQPVRFTVLRELVVPEEIQEIMNNPPSAPAAAEQEPAKAAPEDEAAWTAPGVPETTSPTAAQTAPKELEGEAQPEAEAQPEPEIVIVLPPEEVYVHEPPIRPVYKLPPPVYQPSSFEAAFGDPNRDKLQEIIDRHNGRNPPREVRWVRDAWGRDVMQT